MDDHHNFSYYDDNYTDLYWFLHDCHVELDYVSRRIAVFLLYLVFFILGLVLNCMVVWVNWRRRYSSNGVVFCVLNMAISDLMMMTVVPFFMLGAVMDHVWLWGNFLCQFTNLVFVIAFYSSSLFLAYMTVERYLAVVKTGPRPWGPTEKRKRGLICSALWILSFILAVMEGSHVRLLEWDEPGCYFYPVHNFVGWFTALTFSSLILQFLGPGAVIVTFNLLTLRVVRGYPEGRDHRRRDLWLVHVYSLVFVICWLPFHIDVMLMLLDSLEPRLLSCTEVEHIHFAYAVAQCLSLFHCVANPILYNLLSRKFRKQLFAAVAHHLQRQAMLEGGAENHAKHVVGGRNGEKQGTCSNKKEQEISDNNTSQSDV
ncbi:G-protein coupled receptor 182-like [Osmerus eperlanus]|uniref:G-protein coupled receptor 182-like n=1 Tax=Osmerus eperlanus TaxID=29151 RepID=UPI002E13CFB6